MASLLMSSMARFTFLVIFCLVSSSPVHGFDQKITTKASDNEGIVNETCRLCANKNPSVNYGFCVESIGSDPSSRSADRKGLAVVALNLAMAKAKEVSSTLETLLNGKTTNEYTKSFLEACRTHYADAMSRLKDSVAAVESNRIKDFKASIRGAVDVPGECEDSYEDGEGAESPLAKENDEFFDRVILAHAIATL